MDANIPARFTGTVAAEWGALPGLQELWCAHRGSRIVSSVNRFLAGARLNLHTKLSGTIPPELAWLTQLRRLHLGQNRISGTIPMCVLYEGTQEDNNITATPVD